jgi:hypothetical protein
MREIRLAEHRDIPEIVRLGLRFLRESVFGTAIAENPDQMTTLAGAIIDGRQPGVIFMALDAEDHAIGMVGGLSFVHPLSAELMVTELFWFVEAEARGSIGVRLMKALERWAQQSGAVAIQMIQPFGAERVAGVYEVMGYAPIETAWQRRF